MTTSRTSAGHLDTDIWELGNAELLVADFGVDRRSVKSSTANEAALRWYLAKFESDSSYRDLDIKGYDDCRGSAAQHLHLRKGRAKRVHALLGPSAGSRVQSVGPAPAGTYVAGNQSVGARAQNRGVVIKYDRDINIPGEQVPVPPRKHTTPPSVDCGAQQQQELADALPAAKAIVDNALDILRGPSDAAMKALMRKYFNDDSSKTERELISAFRRIKSGLASSVKYECENPGTAFYDMACDGTTAYVRTWIGMRIHLCAAAFGRSTDELAETMIHEASHMFDFTDDEEYCLTASGCSSGLDRWDAYDNADSFSTFAHDLYMNG